MKYLMSFQHVYEVTSTIRALEKIVFKQIHYAYVSGGPEGICT